MAKQNDKTNKNKPDKTRVNSKQNANQKKAQEKVKKLNKLAVRKIYDAGKAGKEVPTWGKALREAAKKVYK